jgi:hypothetical protein
MGPVFREKRGHSLLSPVSHRHSTIPLRFDDGQEGAVEVRAELLGNVAQHLVEVFRDAERPMDALTDANLPSPSLPPPTPASRCTPTFQRWIVDRGGPWFV